ncbi:tRNA lysidine(34) synthetase TilS [Sphingomonas hankyongi]|uniref:tRNA(Ile)-lysidine synthase n=1 Tax=Sphingomonas hankyongi TaxID=2908209 RepID=A0ABT0S260_9SPHN|nr:tRNA lysidine(34) synthetase TilS [Sphingomonas hankyongi]MCL6729933.1 tRNA lysidine(34) synthetase TilS [Sphingomonas hankyongi]
MAIAAELIDRFARELDRRVAPDARLGLAVSGGADSLAMLLLSAETRPGSICVATVDHKLRPESAEEARFVAGVCAGLDIPHQILEVQWARKPDAGLQERARNQRYRLLGEWAKGCGAAALLTAHHADDQAETFVMRLNRGAGIKGLAAMRPVAPVPGSRGEGLNLIRPLLGWRRSELEEVCRSVGLEPVADPSNRDEQFERIRVRRALAEMAWLDPLAISRSAANLASADAALHWATTQAWEQRVTTNDEDIQFDPAGLPEEILWRFARRAVLQLATEGEGVDLRGRELDQLLPLLRSGKRATLRGVLCNGGKTWRFIPAPNRTRRTRNSR